MIPADYHLHSLSPDARVPLEEVCKAALERGLREIAVTDHMEMYTPDYDGKETGLFSNAFVERYFAEIERCREEFQGRLTIRAAVELGQPAVNPERAAWLLRNHAYDFVLGSIHKLHNVDMAFKIYRQETIRGLCLQNLELLYELADTGDFDVMGHIDVIKRYAARQGIAVDLMNYREQLEPILRRLVERGKGLEINTSGLRQPMNLALPDLPILKLFREMGGEVLTIGSDAHRACDIAANFKDARALALEAGFTSLATFEGRVCSFYKL